MEHESAQKKDKPAISEDDLGTRPSSLSLANNVQRLKSTDDRKKETKTEKRTITPPIKRKRSSSPDPDSVVTADTGGGDSDIKKVKVELPELSLFTPEYLSQLVELQQKIGSLNDKEIQRIVDVVKSSGAYQISNTTFDFDLCALDSGTIRRIQQCLT